VSTKTASGPLRSSNSAASKGPTSVLAESSNPREAFAAVSSVGVSQSAGSSAECAGRKTVKGIVAMTAST
jgi:hypothetical protein